MANMGCGRGGFFYGFMVVELKVAVIVVEGGGVFIMGHMWVHDGYGGGGGGCCGDGGGVAMGFGIEFWR